MAASTIAAGDSSSAQLNSLPSWYTQYGQALTGAGLGALSQVQNYQGATNPDGSPMQRVAGLSNPQTQAVSNVQAQQGQFQPTLGSGINSAQSGVNTVNSATPQYGTAGGTMGTGVGTLGGATGTVQQAEQPLGQMNSTLGTAMSYLNPAQQQLQAGGSTYNSGEANAYLNPYVGNVVNNIATLGDRNLNENVLPGINSTFTGAGQFGSSRNGDFDARAIRDNGMNIGMQQDQTMMQAQQAADTSYAAEKQRQLQSGAGLAGLSTAATNVAGGYGNQSQQQTNIGSTLGNIGTQQVQAGTQQAGLGNDIVNQGQALGSLGSTLGGLAGQGQTLNINDANSLLTAGGLQQNTDQKALDAAYQDFIDRRDYPTSGLGQLSQILPNVSGRIFPDQQSMQVTTPPTTDPMLSLQNIISQINTKSS
jgi:hypothetical protein